MSEPPRTKTVSELLKERLDGAAPASPAILKVTHYIESNPGRAVTSSAAELAREIGLSDATVIRAVQSLGFAGFPELRRTLAAALEGASPAARMHRTLGDVVEDAGHAIDVVLEAHQEALAALRSAAVRERFISAIGVLSGAERIIVFGIGPSSMLARYTSMLLTRVGRQARGLYRTGIGLADQLLDLRPGDALLLLAYGRAYPEITATIMQARRKRLPMVLVTDSLEPRLARHADVIVPAQRGRSEQVALHGATLVALEALVLGLAAIDQPRALEALEQLDALRQLVVRTEKKSATGRPPLAGD